MTLLNHQHNIMSLTTTFFIPQFVCFFNGLSLTTFQECPEFHVRNKNIDLP